VKLIVTEKNIAAKKIAELLAVGKPDADKVYNTPVYRFRRDGEDWVSIGLKGHILEVDFPERMEYRDGAWQAVWSEDLVSANQVTVPATVPAPPWTAPVRKPFSGDGVDLGQWKLQSLPYLVWAPVGKTPHEREIIRSLKNLAKKAESVVIATDFDREGELIGADARQLVRDVNPDAPISRARFSAITKDEIERSFTTLETLDDCLAAAGEARQDIDLVWGAVLTRYLTKVKFAGVGQPRSAGRVQTPTLKLIVDREKERDAFVPEDYWVVRARFESGVEFAATHSTERFKAADEAERVLAAVEGATSGTVADVEQKRRTQAAPTPFNTTALQAAAAAEGLSPSRTMRIAESLYMDGLISYPRVDNTVYPPSLDLKAILRVLDGVPFYHEHVQKILGGKLSATRGPKETTDHPPIHPTGVGDPDKLKPEEWKLYNLVARRFLATLSDPAVVESTKVALDVSGERFVARGDVVVSPGFRSVYSYGQKKDEQLPALEKGQSVAFLGATSEAKQTQPPGRYTEGGIIQEMEKRGLGTKATRHDIVLTLENRRYVEVVDRSVKPTCLGRTVIDALGAFAERITTPDMTAELEAEMDAIANGRMERRSVVEHSRQLLDGVMGQLLPKAAEVGEMLKAAAAEDARVGTCPKSGHDLLVKASPKTRSQFVGCAGWPECDVTFPLPQGKIDPVEEACPECGTPQIKVIQFRSKPAIRCLDPQCPTNYEPNVDVGACATCEEQGTEGRLIAQRSMRTLKRFVRCTNYATCETSYPLPQKGELEATGARCEACNAPVVVVHTGKGPWRICVDPGCPAKAEADKKKPPRRGAPKRAARPKKK